MICTEKEASTEIQHWVQTEEFSSHPDLPVTVSRSSAWNDLPFSLSHALFPEVGFTKLHPDLPTSAVCSSRSGAGLNCSSPLTPGL